MYDHLIITYGYLTTKTINNYDILVESSETEQFLRAMNYLIKSIKICESGSRAYVNQSNLTQRQSKKLLNNQQILTYDSSTFRVNLHFYIENRQFIPARLSLDDNGLEEFMTTQPYFVMASLSISNAYILMRDLDRTYYYYELATALNLSGTEKAVFVIESLSNEY